MPHLSWWCRLLAAALIQPERLTWKDRITVGSALVFGVPGSAFCLLVAMMLFCTAPMLIALYFGLLFAALGCALLWYVAEALVENNIHLRVVRWLYRPRKH